MSDSITTGIIASAVTLVVTFLTQFVAEKYKLSRWVGSGGRPCR